ncbi:MAG TPA: DegV family protein [Clostridiaceae bacterium]
METKIVTDSTSYIPKELLAKYEIEIVSLNILMDGESIREVDLDTSTFYEKMSKSKVIPTSSQPSLEEMYKVFEKIILEESSIVGVFISSKMSGTYSSANLVKDMIIEKYPEAKIEIIDSLSNCMQLGFIALAAAKASYIGKSFKEIVATAKKVIGQSRFLFVPDTLEYLKKGGRIGSASALIGSILSIKPILTVSEGTTTVFQKVRNKQKAISTMISATLDDIKDKVIGGIIIHHINCEEEGRALADKLEKILGISIDICPIGPIIGVHVGPGALGIVYYTDN